jgi:type I restriction enzyme M protein
MRKPMTDEVQRFAQSDISVRLDSAAPANSPESRREAASKESQPAVVPQVASELIGNIQRLRYSDLSLVTDGPALLRRLDELLHSTGQDREGRHTILLKLLLVKLYDEERGKDDGGADMLIQDFCNMPPEFDPAVEGVFTRALETALRRYNGILAPGAPATIRCPVQVLRKVSTLLCRVRFLGGPPQVIQDLFTYFGRFHYRVDLAQYFIPFEVIRLIVEVVNPRSGEYVVDPACGTADFLAATRQIVSERHGEDISATLHGCDIEPLAAHLSILNMLLNGDRGLAHIEKRDTLRDGLEHEGKYDVVLCNPPFGTQNVERRPEVLARFELVSAKRSGSGRIPKAQEAGLLHLEGCLKAVKPGGRVAVLVPNGYLGNRSDRFIDLRRWLLRNARLAAVIGFPRFTFKKSGVDVSVSALIFERRLEPLSDLSNVPDYPIHFNLMERVGWDLRTKRATQIFKRDPRDGTELLDSSGARIPDSDFESARIDALTSAAVDAFPWMAQGERKVRTAEGWSVMASRVAAHPDLSLDPKRWCRKYTEVLESILKLAHIRVGQIIHPVTRLLRKESNVIYRYVEIERIYEIFGGYMADECYGWTLPERARLVAAPGDIFIANIWSSAGKWMIADEEACDHRLIVTTGCSHFELIPGQEALLPDLVFGLCSEAFRMQMRALASGSDGQAVVSVADICSIVLPRMRTPAVREQIERRIREGQTGQLVLPRVVQAELAAVAPEANVPPRSSTVVQV